MSGETEAQRQQGEDEFSQRMKRDGDLVRLLCEHIWAQRVLRIAGEDYEVISGEDVPGFEDDLYVVLLRRTSDGQVFDAEIDVSINPVCKPVRAVETVSAPVLGGAV